MDSLSKYSLFLSNGTAKRHYFEFALEQYFQSYENQTEKKIRKERDEEHFPTLSSHEDFERVLTELLGVTPKFDTLEMKDLVSDSIEQEQERLVSEIVEKVLSDVIDKQEKQEDKQEEKQEEEKQEEKQEEEKQEEKDKQEDKQEEKQEEEKQEEEKQEEEKQEVKEVKEEKSSWCSIS
jgi:hypothetical protein